MQFERRTIFSISVKGLVAIVCLFAANISSAQTQSAWTRAFGKTKVDSNYISSYYDNIQVTLVGINKGHTAKVYNSGVKKSIKLGSNTGYTFGFGLDYKFLTMEYSKSIPGILNPDPRKGNSESFALRFGLTGGKFVFSGLVQGYQGLYVQNPQEVVPGWSIPQNGYPRRDDVGSVVLFGSLNYFFNARKYSTMAALWQIDRQLQSAGSFVTGLTFRVNLLYADSTIIPEALYSSFPNQDEFQVGFNRTIGLNFGYAYTYVFQQRFFASMFLIPGVNLQAGEIRYQNGNFQNYQQRLGFHGDLRLIVGYNGDRYYGGLHFANHYLNHALKNTISIGDNTTYLRFFLGRRFAIHSKNKAHRK